MITNEAIISNEKRTKQIPKMLLHTSMLQYVIFFDIDTIQLKVVTHKWVQIKKQKKKENREQK